jgi:hypothetical protein
MGKGIDISVTELHDATARYERLQSTLSDAAWRARPAAGKWSAIECIEHLNITDRWYVDHFNGITERLQPEKSAERMSFMGWIVWRSQRSKSKYSNSKTAASFVPPSDLNVETVLAEFQGLQDQLFTIIRRISHLPLSKAVMTSPFNEKVKYNLYSAVRVLTVHQLRHLEQAEEAAKLAAR